MRGAPLGGWTGLARLGPAGAASRRGPEGGTRHVPRLRHRIRQAIHAVAPQPVRRGGGHGPRARHRGSAGPDRGRAGPARGRQGGGPDACVRRGLPDLRRQTRHRLRAGQGHCQGRLQHLEADHLGTFRHPCRCTAAFQRRRNIGGRTGAGNAGLPAVHHRPEGQGGRGCQCHGRAGRCRGLDQRQRRDPEGGRSWR